LWRAARARECNLRKPQPCRSAATTRGNNDGLPNLEVVRLANVTLDQIGTIGQVFHGFHYNFIV
jgi:hypothetical protein